MKIIYILFIVIVLFSSTCHTQVIDGQVVLCPATIWPQNIDELYTLIDTGTGNWVFTGQCPVGVDLLYWKEIKNFHSGKEETLFYQAGLEYLFGELQSCKPDNDRVAFYGPALPKLLKHINGK